MARSRLELLVSPENLDFDKKLFLKDVFNVNHMRSDELFPPKSKLIQTLESIVKDLDGDRYELVYNNTSANNLNYFIDHVVVDRITKKK